MPATIQIQDAGIQEIFSQRLFLFETLIAAPAATPVFDQDISVDGEVYYASSFLKWSTVGARASVVFGAISNLTSVTDQSGLVYYGDSSLSASNTLDILTDGKVYKIQRPRDERVHRLRLRGGEKILTSDGKVGFEFTFSSSSENWFPWSVTKSRLITQVLNEHRLKVDLITDSFGNTFSFNQPVGVLQTFKPGNGYIINVNASFTLTVLEEEDRTINPLDFVYEPPTFTLSNVINSENNNNIVEFVVTADALKEAIEQIPTHSSIIALKQSEINRYKDGSLPGATEIKTFYDARGLDTTFNALMKLSDEYAGTVNVYDRKDFQADYNLKVSALNFRDVKYTFTIKNNNAEVISQSSTFTAFNLEKQIGDLTLRVINPITSIATIQAMNFIITTDSVDRKYQIHHYNRESYGEPRQEFFSTANASNLTFPNRTKIFDLFWFKNKKLIVHNLYLSNPT